MGRSLETLRAVIAKTGSEYQKSASGFKNPSRRETISAMPSKSKFTNRLIEESSPYLLQHAHNPVDWFPWGDEAFDRARVEDKPVLVSIGYSACHWCHVMEHESFEDEAVAAVMNENFVNIKVDMEERPDVDQIYMNFVQLTTGRGGWPMNVFLTPEKRPFFGGTYFPPTPRYGSPSWLQLLASIADAYRERRDELETSANEIVGQLRLMNIVELAETGPSDDLSEYAFASMSRSFDAVNGGFGSAPKFPPAMTLEFLLRYHFRTGNENALSIVVRTLEKMACGGIYDQLGGGFHRYSVDAVWLVPHFERMLYDNAQLARVYLHAYQVLSGPGRKSGILEAEARSGFFRNIASETLDYLRREMLDPSGAFYSTQDADSEGEEGKFFIWTPNEIRSVLGAKDAEHFCEIYDVTEDGNFEGKNILHLDRSDTLSDFRSKDELDDARKKLLEARGMRVKPGRDEKVLTAWNGLILAAFADAARVLCSDIYFDVARQNAGFIKRELMSGGRLYRVWKDGKAKLNGYVEDYANVADGLIELYQVSGDVDHIKTAIHLVDVMIAEFWDPETGGFYFTSNDHEELIVRSKDFFDNATPSGNSVAADVLLKLARFTGDSKYERYATNVLRLAASQVRRFPQGFGRALSTMEFYLGKKREFVIVGPRGNELEKMLRSRYLPDSVMAFSTDAGVDGRSVNLLQGRAAVDGRATVYICENSVCGTPIIDSAGLASAF